MKITWDIHTVNALRQKLDACEDAEASGLHEYTLDLYGEEPALSFELMLLEGGVDILAAAELAFDEVLDGYYLSARRFDAQTLGEILKRWALEAEA